VTYDTIRGQFFRDPNWSRFRPTDLHNFAKNVGVLGKRKSLKFSGDLPNLKSFKSGATSNRKSVCIALFFNKLYLYYDVSPLNKVFTTLHRSTQFCVSGSISVCEGRHLFGIINISKKFF
jgi:hypothetical protein